MKTAASYDPSGHWFYQNSSPSCYSQIRPESATGRYHHSNTSSSSAWRILSLLTKALCFQCAMGHIPIPDIDRSSLHPREIKAVDSSFAGFFDSYRTAQEWLRFRKDDPREKLLYLTADSDWNGALDPDFIYPVMSSLNQKYDIKYKVIKKYQDVCQQINEAATIGKLAHIFINGHGNPQLLQLSETPAQNVEEITKHNDFSCFSDLALNGKVILMACSNGKPQNGDPCDNIAQDIATSARRTVIAATDLLVCSRIKTLLIDPLMLFHDPFFHEGKIFDTHLRVFYPRFPSCQNLIEHDLHPREQAVINAVSANLIARKFLWEQPTFTEMQDYLRLCKDNPKKKFIFLSSKEEKLTHNIPWSYDPGSYAKFLTDIADQFDLKFKVIERENDICTEVRAAKKIGEIAAVFIHAPGSIYKLELPDDMSTEDSLERFPKCLSETHSTTRIFLAGGMTGYLINDRLDDNFAYKVSRAAGRTVFAPTSFIFADELTITSYDPIEIYHPKRIPHWLISAWDTEENRFRMFK